MSFSVNLGLLAVPKVKTQFKRISKRFQPKEEVLSKLENIFRHKSVPVITEGQKCFRSLQFNIRTTNKKISKVRYSEAGIKFTNTLWDGLAFCLQRLTTQDSSSYNTAWDSLWYIHTGLISKYISQPLVVYSTTQDELPGTALKLHKYLAMLSRTCADR